MINWKITFVYILVLSLNWLLDGYITIYVHYPKENSNILIIFVFGYRKCLIIFMSHSSEIKGLCLMKWLSETLQNLPYFMYTKTQSCFFPFFIYNAILLFSLMNALVYDDIDQGIHWRKSKVARNEKWNKQL